MVLQDRLPVQPVESIKETAIRDEMPTAVVLQDVLTPLNPMLVGLIAHLFELRLQDDIDQTTRRLVQLGSDILNRSHHEDHQNAAAP